MQILTNADISKINAGMGEYFILGSMITGGIIGGIVAGELLIETFKNDPFWSHYFFDNAVGVGSAIGAVTGLGLSSTLVALIDVATH